MGNFHIDTHNRFGFSSNDKVFLNVPFSLELEENLIQHGLLQFNKRFILHTVECDKIVTTETNDTIEATFWGLNLREEPRH